MIILMIVSTIAAFIISLIASMIGSLTAWKVVPTAKRDLDPAAYRHVFHRL